MNIEKDQIITLDNSENYFIASTTTYNDNLYALLINVNKDDDHMIVKINKNTEANIEVIENENELSTLALLLQENLY